MGRGKLRMELINSEKSRRTTFQKRRKGLMRKAYELATLCDVGTCVIIYGPQQKLQAPEIQTWPTNPNDVDRLINLYKSTEARKRVKKSSNLHDFFSDRRKKIDVEISKVKKDILEAKYPRWDDSISTLSEEELRIFLDNLDLKIEVVRRRVDMAGGNSQSSDVILGRFSGFHNQTAQHPNNFMQSHFDENKSTFMSHLNTQFPYQNPHEQMSQMLGPANPISSMNLLSFPTISSFNYPSDQFFGGYSNPSNWYGTSPLDPSFNLPMLGMFNDPSSSIGHYPLPLQSILPGQSTYHSGFGGISSQINISDQINTESDYIINEYIIKTNKDLMTF